MSCLFICYISYHIIYFQSILKNSNNLVLVILNQFEVDTLYFKLFYYLNSNYYFTIRYSESIKGNSLLKNYFHFLVESNKHSNNNSTYLHFYEFRPFFFTSRNTNDWFYLSVSVGHYWVLPPCVRCSISVD